MAEIVPSANSTLNAIKQVVSDCKGAFGPTMIITTKYSEKEIRENIEKFSEQLASILEIHKVRSNQSVK